MEDKFIGNAGYTLAGPGQLKENEKDQTIIPHLIPTFITSSLAGPLYICSALIAYMQYMLPSKFRNKTYRDSYMALIACPSMKPVIGIARLSQKKFGSRCQNIELEG